MRWADIGGVTNRSEIQTGLMRKSREQCYWAGWESVEQDLSMADHRA